LIELMLRYRTIGRLMRTDLKHCFFCDNDLTAPLGTIIECNNKYSLHLQITIGKMCIYNFIYQDLKWWASVTINQICIALKNVFLFSIY
jgi:hypothetical protein